MHLLLDELAAGPLLNAVVVIGVASGDEHCAKGCDEEPDEQVDCESDHDSCDKKKHTESVNGCLLRKP